MTLPIADLHILYSQTFDARGKWENILLALGVSTATIESIRIRRDKNPDDCYREGLSEWLRGGNASWGQLVEALSGPTVGHHKLGTKIDRVFIQNVAEATGNILGIPSDENEQAINEDLAIHTQEKIGEGAFGAVFKGRYKQYHCAVKVLHHTALAMQTKLPAGSAEDSTVKLFESECRMLESFQHPNIVQHLSTAKHPQSGHAILVTELLDCNLRQYLSTHTQEQLTSNCQLSLSKDIAAGLCYLHRKQIIHRDLCGDNILLKLTKPVPVAKISDFGMSRLLDSIQTSSTLTAIAHRRAYLPPEALRLEDEQYDYSLDVFSLGVIMVQITCKLGTIKSPKDRSVYVAQIPANNTLKPLIDQCLQEDMTKRPSAGDVYDKLERWLTDVSQTTPLTGRMASPILTLQSDQFTYSKPLNAESTATTVPEAEPTVTTVPEAEFTVTTVPEAESTVTTVPEAESTVTTVPEAESTVTSVPEAESTVTTVPEAESTVTTVPEAESTVTTVPEHLTAESITIQVVSTDENQNKKNYSCPSAEALKNKCWKHSLAIACLIHLLIINYLLLLGVFGSVFYFNSTISERSNVIQIDEVYEVLIARLNFSVNDHTTITFTERNNHDSELFPISLFTGNCASMQNATRNVLIDDDFTPMTSNRIDERYFQFDSTLEYTILVQGHNDTQCTVKFVVFSDLENYKMFQSNKLWSASYMEFCIEDEVSTIPVAFNKTLYYYTGLYVSFPGRIQGRISYQISGSILEYSIFPFSFGCHLSSSNMHSCTVTLEGGEACIIGQVAQRSERSNPNVAVVYYDNNTLTRNIISLYFFLPLIILLGIEVCLFCVFGGVAAESHK